jgi:hypothetical protein
LPLPDARHGRHRYRVFDALVHHIKVPAATHPMPPKHGLEVVSVQYGSLLEERAGARLRRGHSLVVQKSAMQCQSYV